MTERDPRYEKVSLQMTPAQRALFEMMLNIAEWEKESSDSSDTKVEAGWVRYSNLEETTGILEEVLAGSLYALPLNDVNRGYTGLSLYVDSPGSSLGSPDIRIFNHGDSLFLQANLGRLAGMDPVWQRVIGGIDFPIGVADESGYRFNNAAAS